MVVKESNKLIANFMGIPFKDGNYINSYELMSVFPYLEYSRPDLKFDHDWNWLMAVVEKINNLPDGKWYIHISDGESYPVVSIEDGNTIPKFDVMINVENCEGFGEDIHLTKIEATYKAVVNFINWYNNERNI